MKNLDLGNLYNYTEEIFSMIESDVALEIVFGEPFTKQLACCQDRTSIYGFEEAASIEVFNRYQCTSKEVVSKFIKAANSRFVCLMTNKKEDIYYFRDPDYDNIRLSIFIINDGSEYIIMFNINWYPVSYQDTITEEDENIIKSGYYDGNHCIEKCSDGSIKKFKIKGGNVKWKK